MNKKSRIPVEIVPSVNRENLSSLQVGREMMDLIDSGARMVVSGTAKKDPDQLLFPHFKPIHKINLFENKFYFTNVLQIPELRFFVCYLVQKNHGNTRSTKPTIFPRIIYKDLSLAWRAASHYTKDNGDIWVGKGDVREEFENGEEYVTSNEATTDLPLEMQTAVESLLAFSKKGKRSNQERALELVLRRSPSDRVEPYQDFTAPRKKAAANPANLINKGKSVAVFKRTNDPTSLKISKGYEPDFADGIIERSKSKSRLYGGTLKRFRILSANRRIQYYFIAGPKHVWILPPQATTTELSSYGVRTIDVEADDDLFIPGYEYHHYEETSNGTELYSQIPPGFAGEECPDDDAKADASLWLDKIPLIQQFRRRVN